MKPFDYVILRAAPRIQRGEFINVGAVLYCRALDYLGAGWDVKRERLLALDPGVDVDVVCASLEQVRAICAGDPVGGPAAATSIGERFRWLAAPRSTVVHPGPIHSGITTDPAAELERLLDAFVR
ncbi:DUF3037 domain-containing protein [Kribbella jejuensis]|uniref:DUF3037 family protein n=1 Tax=Kribbella jejuensis TaxID=236068 RepID=A0A542ELT4_9ACTN|nr:DUF3037 domain-containing protein [Kribbella jejuensis]TQJ16300.1 DUF3037 family protein [Kribbella jejuensis]